MLQDARMRIAWSWGRRRVDVIAMNCDLNLGALETVRVGVVGMEDKVHGNEEEIVDDGVVERIRPIVAVLKSTYMGRNVRFTRQAALIKAFLVDLEAVSWNVRIFGCRSGLCSASLDRWVRRLGLRLGFVVPSFEML
jgi:hypothetical protein